MAVVGPCKGCEDRKVGCHSDCERYITWAKEFHGDPKSRSGMVDYKGYSIQHWDEYRKEWRWRK